MENMLFLLATLGIIALIEFLNEKLFHLTKEISLMLFSVVIGFVLTVIMAIMKDETVKELLQGLQVYNIENFLMNGVLCFMLFAGSCHLKLGKFRKEARPIGVLSFLCTSWERFFMVSCFMGFLPSSICLSRFLSA